MKYALALSCITLSIHGMEQPPKTTNNIARSIAQRQIGINISRKTCMTQSILAREQEFDNTIIQHMQRKRERFSHSNTSIVVRLLTDTRSSVLTSKRSIASLLRNLDIHALSNPEVLSRIEQLRFFDFSVRSRSNGQFIKTPFLLYALANIGDRQTLITIIQGVENLSVTNIYGNNCFHIACKNEHLIETMELLKMRTRNSIDINTPNTYGDTPLHCAASNTLDPYSKENIEYLVQEGANVNAANSRGDTPLHEAACLLLDQQVSALLEHHADCNAPNHCQQTPWTLIRACKKKAGKKCYDIMKPYNTAQKLPRSTKKLFE
jgi:Ankyrin repeats (3 copies)